MTKTLYLEDSYQKECDATVVSVKDGKFIELDQTVLYARGGGQPNDEGKLVRTSDGKEFNVVFVGKFDGKISHQVVPEIGLNVGDVVKVVVDWDRRYRHMRMHTAMHVLCSVLFKEEGALITGNQIGLEKSRCDFSLESYSPDRMADVVSKANELLSTDAPVLVSSMPREEALQRPELARLAKGLIEGLEIVRIVDIKDVDTQADGGTHVKSLKEVGKIELLKCENKGKSNRRLYFALQDASNGPK